MKKFFAWLLGLTLLLSAGPARGEAPWSAEEWAMVAAALSSDEECPVPESRRLQPLSDERAPSRGWMRILLLSTDAADITRNYGRTAVMLLCAVNLRTGETRLISLPEEARASLPGLPEEIRLKYVNCFGGPLWAARALRDALDAPIERYCAVNLAAFEKIVDALGGVTLALTPEEGAALGLDDGEKESEQESQKESPKKLTGEQALRFVRLRRAEEENTRPRRLLEAVFRQIVSGQTGEQALSLIDLLLPDVDTNLSANDLLDLVFALCEQETPGTFTTQALPWDEDAPLGPEAAAACRALLEE